MLELNMRFDGGLTPEALLSMCGLEDGGPVQEAIDRAVIAYMEPYWAYDTGELVNSVYGATTIGSGQIVYDTPYAQAMYYGIGRNGPINYHTDKHPQAGAYPFERMLADHYNDIVEEARRVAGGQHE